MIPSLLARAAHNAIVRGRLTLRAASLAIRGEGAVSPNAMGIPKGKAHCETAFRRCLEETAVGAPALPGTAFAPKLLAVAITDLVEKVR